MARRNKFCKEHSVPVNGNLTAPYETVPETSALFITVKMLKFAALLCAQTFLECFPKKAQVQVQHSKFLSPRALREHIKDIEKTTANALQESLEALCLQEPTSDDKHESIKLWWAGKELAMDKKLCDYIGANDKTKIVIKLRQTPNEP